MLIGIGKDNYIYFSHGLFAVHTDGVYNPAFKELTIINDKYLPKIMKHLRRIASHEGITTVKLTWFEGNK